MSSRYVKIPLIYIITVKGHRNPFRDYRVTTNKSSVLQDSESRKVAKGAQNKLNETPQCRNNGGDWTWYKPQVTYLMPNSHGDYWWNAVLGGRAGKPTWEVKQNTGLPCTQMEEDLKVGYNCWWEHKKEDWILWVSHQKDIPPFKMAGSNGHEAQQESQNVTWSVVDSFTRYQKKKKKKNTSTRRNYRVIKKMPQVWTVFFLY